MVSIPRPLANHILTVFPPQAESTSQESECDHESVCSDGSWIITPAPTFRVTTTNSTAHPLENLLIEHPTMSVYGHVQRDGDVGSSEDEDRLRDEEVERERQRAQAQEREVVLLRNRERYQMSVQLQLPLTHHKTEQSLIKTEKGPLRVTRKSTRRHNNIKQRNGRGKQNLTIKKCSFVAGRRRC